LKKFKEIVAAQGGNPDIKSTDIKVGEHSVDVLTKKSGYVSRIMNKELVRVARAAGSPRDKGAGVVLSKKVGSKVDEGETILTIYADNEQKMQDALAVAMKLEPVIIEGMVLARIPSFTRTIR
jgi:AMP phosphorylase